MKKNLKFDIIFLIVFLFVCDILTSLGKDILHKAYTEDNIKQSSVLAGRIVDYYLANGSKTKWCDVYNAITISKIMASRYFPNGEFDYIDLVSIAMYESSFNPLKKGRHGEIGMWQVKPSDWHGVAAETQLDLRKNTDNCAMACIVLKEKSKMFDSHKNTIIAYNGFVVTNGKPNQSYWKEFIRHRRIIETLESKEVLK